VIEPQVLLQATAAPPPQVSLLAGFNGAATAALPVAPSSRFYRALYAKLGSWDLRSSSKHAMLLNLVFKGNLNPKP
jgi:hypothetical protein